MRSIAFTVNSERRVANLCKNIPVISEGIAKVSGQAKKEAKLPRSLSSAHANTCPDRIRKEDGVI